jgi:hypothetical protein
LDKACSDLTELLDWCRKEVPGRPRIELAISAAMMEELRATVQNLPEKAWEPLRKVTEKGPQGMGRGRVYPESTLPKERDEARSILDHSDPTLPERLLRGH